MSDLHPDHGAAADEAARSTALAVQERHAPLMPSAPIVPSGDEIDRVFRIAKAFVQSGLFKGTRNLWPGEQAAEAFAKMLVGRDLGLSPGQAMAGLHIVEGRVELHYATIGRFVREHGMDYRVEWLHGDTVVSDSHEGIDGCRITFERERDGREVGVSTFTLADAQRAGIKQASSVGGMYAKYRRNMLLARAMSNGARMYVPEAIGGLPVYAEGEIDRGEVVGSEDAGALPGWGTLPVDWAHEVERRVRRAEALGHRGLSSLAAAQMTLRSAAQPQVEAWLARADAELERFKSGAETGADDLVTNAKVVGDGESMPEVTVDEANAEVAAMREAAKEADEPIGLTAEELAVEITKAEEKAKAALTDREHREALADLERLREAQGQLRIDG
jgi:hypothetical protein